LNPSIVSLLQGAKLYDSLAELKQVDALKVRSPHR
jgi:hypothetical protein